MPLRPSEHRHDAPAALPLVAFIAGIVLAPVLINPLASATGLAFCGLLTARFSRRGVVALLFLATGVLIGVRQLSIRIDEGNAFHRIDPDRFVEVEAPVIGDWSRRGSAFVLKADSFTASGYRYRSPLLLYIGQQPPAPGLASVIRFQGFLRQNDRGQFTASIKSPRLIEYVDPLPWWHPQRWNRELAGRIAPLASGHPDAVAIVEAVALGRAGRLSDATREGFRRGGTYHLLVFSGLQITAGAAAIAWLLRLIGVQRGSDWFLLLFAGLAPLFIGGSASVSRAAVAIAAYALSRLLHRPTSLENLWCLAALLRLIAVPGDFREPGFQLTYGGAGALLFVARPVENRAARYVAAGAAAEMTVTPITLFHFHQFALGGSLLTFLLAPVIFTILLLAVPLFILPCEALLMPIEILHRFCDAVNAAGAPLSGFFTAPSPAAAILAFAATLAAIALLASRPRAMAITLALAIPAFDAIFRAHSRSSSDEPQLVMLDVGQGDSILLRNGEQALLVDGGGRLDHSRFGESTLLPLLVDHGVLQLEAVILTHADPDHCGGLPAVLQHLRTKELWVSPPGLRGTCAAELLHVARERGVNVRTARRGERITAAGFPLRILAAGRRYKRAPDNNASIVLMTIVGRRRILLTGDIEKEAERSLAGGDLRADILKVAHHGSRSSSTGEFLSAVSPRLALISAGRRNLYGHPHPTVIEALNTHNAIIRRTDQHGAIRVRIDPRNTLRIETEIDTPRVTALQSMSRVTDLSASGPLDRRGGIGVVRDPRVVP